MLTPVHNKEMHIENTEMSFLTYHWQRSESFCTLYVGNDISQSLSSQLVSESCLERVSEHHVSLSTTVRHF